MDQIMMKHMETVRDITLNTLGKIKEERADIIPQGFNNNIRWNLGHIAFVQEKIVFGISGGTPELPAEYKDLFSAGTSPADWGEHVPSLSEIRAVLQDQTNRIKAFIPEHYHEDLKEPFTNSAGITFNTVGETFLFSFFHEAMHLETIKQIHKAIKREEAAV